MWSARSRSDLHPGVAGPLNTARRRIMAEREVFMRPRSMLVLLSFLGSSWMMSGCPRPSEPGPGPGPGPGPAPGDDQISEKNPAYVTLKRDVRRCAAPLCGGYFITEVNRTREAQYVSGLEFR